MSKAFWIFAALDGCGLLTLLVMTLNHKGHNDGGREMSLFFFVLLPLVVLGGACAAFAWSSNPVVRWAMLALVVLPPGFYAFVGLGSGIQKLTTDAGSGYANPDMAATVRAVARLDVEEVRRHAPRMDKDIDQSEANAPLRMVIERMLQEKRRQVNPPLERHLEIVRLLLENGAKPAGAMEVAAWPNSPELLRLLFQYGADPNGLKKYGNSPHFLDVLGGGMLVESALPCVKVYVEAGMDVNAPTPHGTPLAFATNTGKFDIALYLIEKGADPKAADFREELERKLRPGQAGFGPSAELQELARRAMAN